MPTKDCGCTTIPIAHHMHYLPRWAKKHNYVLRCLKGILNKNIILGWFISDWCNGSFFAGCKTITEFQLHNFIKQMWQACFSFRAIYSPSTIKHVTLYKLVQCLNLKMINTLYTAFNTPVCPKAYNCWLLSTPSNFICLRIYKDKPTRSCLFQKRNLFSPTSAYQAM